MKRRSISERLAKAGSLSVRREIALDWAAAWRAEHEALIGELEVLIGRGQAADAGQVLGQLKAMHEKRFGALPRVIDALSDEDMA